MTKKIDAAIEFYRNFPPFVDLNMEGLIELAKKCYLKNNHINDIVLKQGDETHHV